MTYHEFYRKHNCSPEERRELHRYLFFLRMKGMISFFFGVDL